MSDPDIKVRAATFKSLTGFLCSIEEIEHLKKFEGVLQTLLEKCIECIKADEDAGATSLRSLVDLIEIHPSFVKSIVGELINLFTEIISSTSISESVRITGLSGFVSMSASLAPQIRKSDIFKQKTVPAIIKMMAEAD